MFKCVNCEKTAVAICIKCQKPLCEDHVASNVSLQMIEELETNVSQTKSLTNYICLECQKKEQKKRLMWLTIIAGIVIAVGIVILILRLGGYLEWKI